MNPRPNHAMQRTAGRLGPSLCMKFPPQPAATHHPRPPSLILCLVRSIMRFIVFRGTVGKSDFKVPPEQDTVHGYICSSIIEDRVRRLASANQLAKTRGFVLKTVDGTEMAVPWWRAWLPTEQGRLLRETKRL